jgi:EAL domain-containing protein (putative c-di-GMP-specific phosphodiesterase class I)
MQNWPSIFAWGRRASDVGGTAPAVPQRDLALEALIAHESVQVLFQPLIEPRSGMVVGAEALARSPTAVSADALFARAAAANLGERLSRLVQRKALRNAAVWEGPLKDLNLSINLLPGELSRPGYEQWLLGEISAIGIDARRITVEITESALLIDQPSVVERLAVLRNAGISIAVDDFGTGYASLAYLTALPLDMIKIDRGLITNIVKGTRERIVVKALLQLARELDLKVVVEGVESDEQLALLTDWGVDFYQGFVGARPLAHEELTHFVGASNRLAA